MKSGDRRRWFKSRRVSDWCDIDHRASNGVGCDAEPGAQHGGVSCRVVMLMLPHVGGELRVHNPTERHKPERQPYDSTLSNPMGHRPYRRAADFSGSFF